MAISDFTDRCGCLMPSILPPKIFSSFAHFHNEQAKFHQIQHCKTVIASSFDCKPHLHRLNATFDSNRAALGFCFGCKPDLRRLNADSDSNRAAIALGFGCMLDWHRLNATFDANTAVIACGFGCKRDVHRLNATSDANRTARYYKRSGGEGGSRRQRGFIDIPTRISTVLFAKSAKDLYLKSSPKQEARAAEDQEEAFKHNELEGLGIDAVNIGQETSSKAEEQSGPGSSVLSFLCPLLKIIGGQDPTKPRNAFLEAATSGVASLARLPWGSTVIPEIASTQSRTRPLQLFQLYEFEACPFCRRVREALTELDLSAEVYPCPKGSLRHRPYVLRVGGKEQFPYFVDPNKGVTLYESSDIVHYLFREYGGGIRPSIGLLESTLITGWVPTILRVGRGMTMWEKKSQNAPEKMLQLYSCENNQFARIVREALCELEIPYILRNVGKGSSFASELLQIAGSTKVPFLVDPNTGVSMGESLDIVGYLFKTYAT
ncbi:hypothetical protein O6H91_09G081100 [Diphasiastrum complanatum]|uniref:Uncharacterized protein n=1 Tax=Diphasiastrum complanatum TaxID=34168 RepID=A0ACC2CR79_DIPCM|nr:hypothetical protein O6H91_09G081100 [Diphasiastrum complanatum]